MGQYGMLLYQQEEPAGKYLDQQLLNNSQRPVPEDSELKILRLLLTCTSDHHGRQYIMTLLDNFHHF